MKEIDFLPSRFREQDARRRAQLWHFAVLLLFAGCVCLAAAGQYALRRSVRQQLATVRARHGEAVTRQARLTQLRKDLETARADASLYCFLQHPWPRTQLLAEIVTPLPRSLVLTELSVLDATPVGRSAPRSPPAPASGGTAEPAAASDDLQQLQQRLDRQQTTVDLAGVASDTGELHRYVEMLGKSALFQSAKLDSLESLGESGALKASSFLVRLIAKPGYGRPGGPQGPSPEGDQGETADSGGPR